MKHVWLLAAAALCVDATGGALAAEAAAKPDLTKAQQTVNQVCAACHGADGNSISPANPNLAGQQAEYITLQLAHFKSGVRDNAIMKGMVANLTPDDMKALGVYFYQQKPKGLAAEDPALVLTGQRLFRGGNAATGLPACAACHTPTGAGIPVRYPRLGGQYAAYTYAQLKAFKAGERGMDKGGVDVNGKVMAQIAAGLGDSDMRALVEYAAGLH